MLTYLVFKGFARSNNQILALFSDGRHVFQFTRDLLKNRIENMQNMGMDTHDEEEVLQNMEKKSASTIVSL